MDRVSHAARRPRREAQRLRIGRHRHRVADAVRQLIALGVGITEKWRAARPCLWTDDVAHALFVAGGPGRAMLVEYYHESSASCVYGLSQHKNEGALSAYPYHAQRRCGGGAMSRTRSLLRRPSSSTEKRTQPHGSCRCSRPFSGRLGNSERHHHRACARIPSCLIKSRHCTNVSAINLEERSGVEPSDFRPHGDDRLCTSVVPRRSAAVSSPTSSTRRRARPCLKGSIRS